MPATSTIGGLVGVTFMKIEYAAVASVRMERISGTAQECDRIQHHKQLTGFLCCLIRKCTNAMSANRVH